MPRPVTMISTRCAYCSGSVRRAVERLGVQHRVVDPLELERDLALDDLELAVDAGGCGRGGGGHRGLFDTGLRRG